MPQYWSGIRGRPLPRIERGHIVADQHFVRRAKECREAAERTRDQVAAQCFRAAALNFEAQARRVARYRELLGTELELNDDMADEDLSPRH
jgi:hypothetical protein